MPVARALSLASRVTRRSRRVRTAWYLTDTGTINGKTIEPGNGVRGGGGRRGVEGWSTDNPRRLARKKVVVVVVGRTGNPTFVRGYVRLRE